MLVHYYKPWYSNSLGETLNEAVGIFVDEGKKFGGCWHCVDQEISSFARERSNLVIRTEDFLIGPQRSTALSYAMSGGWDTPSTSVS
jgi:hypothetical protein